MTISALYKIRRPEGLELSCKRIDLIPPEAQYSEYMNFVLHVINENLEDIYESSADYLFVEITDKMLSLTGCVANGTPVDLLVVATIKTQIL